MTGSHPTACSIYDDHYRMYGGSVWEFSHSLSYYSLRSPILWMNGTLALTWLLLNDAAGGRTLWWVLIPLHVATR